MTDIKDEKKEDQPAAIERMLLNQILVGRIDAAVLLGISPRTVDNLVARGSLRPRRIGARCLFLVEELKLFAKRLGRSA